MENQDSSYKDDAISLEGTDNVTIQEEVPLSSPETTGANDPRRAPKFGFLSRYRLVIIIVAIVLLLLAGVIVTITIMNKTSKKTTTVIINTQTLDNGTLNKITAKAGGSGKVTQQLTISPSTIFGHNVSIQGNLTTRGTSTLQGAVSTGNLDVHGNSSISGDTNIGGNLSANGQISATSLSVGSITLSSLNLSGDINFSGHLVPNGSTPAVRPSLAASSGTATISGNDTAGVVIITIGKSPVQTGEMAIITFNKSFKLTPKVQLTPVNPAAASLKYYVTQSPTFFTIQTITAPSSSTQYDFNYLVTE